MLVGEEVLTLDGRHFGHGTSGPCLGTVTNSEDGISGRLMSRGAEGTICLYPNLITSTHHTLTLIFFCYSFLDEGVT